jgi:hypothetical protein
MNRMCRRTAGLLACVMLAAATMPAGANDSAFPFGSELALDAAPPPGTKRVPTIEIDQDGAAAFNLWCARVSGAASVTQDAALLAALSQVTNWRRTGDIVDFLGATNLRFRLMTN